MSLAPLLARLAATDDAGSPWLAPYRDVAARVLAQHRTAAPLASALNRALDGRATIVLDAGALRFVPQSDLPAGEAYETFISRTARVPTRDNPHDLLNALVWLAAPRLKTCLNRLHAAALAAEGVAAARGPLRDALTLFDENAALWHAPEPLTAALRRRDWQALFVTQRALWREASVELVGHALLEKLLSPRKAITAHAWVVPGDGSTDALLATLTPERLAAKPFLPLPVLGVPGWSPANADPGFYADATVFRPARR